MKVEKTRNTPNGRLTPGERLALVRKTLSGATLKEAAALFNVNEKTAVKWVRRYRKYGMEGLSVGFSPRAAACSLLPRAAPQVPFRYEPEVLSLSWFGPCIEVPAELARSKFTALELRSMKIAAAVDLAAARRSVSATNQFSAACATIYSTAKLMLAHLGLRSSERMRQDLAMFAGMGVFGAGTKLPELTNRFLSLRERYHIVLLSSQIEVSSEQADAALRLADLFHGEVTAFLLQCVRVPVATPEELISSKVRCGLHDAALTLPLPLLNTTSPGTTGRWVAVRACHYPLNGDEAYSGAVYEESFVVVDLHRALPCSASDQDPANPLDCLIHRRERLHLTTTYFGSWQEDPSSPTGSSFAFEIGSHWFNNDTTELIGNETTVLGAVACVLRHRPVTMQALKRRAKLEER